MRYFLVSFYRKPGGQIDEMVKVTKRVRPADYSTFNIIMDYGLRKIEKCVVEGNKLTKTFDELSEYYRKVYPNLVYQLEKEAPITMKEKEKKTGK
jgi:hypothetical protein